MQSSKAKQVSPTAAQRAAQSKRDKALAAQAKGSSGAGSAMARKSKKNRKAGPRGGNLGQASVAAAYSSGQSSQAPMIQASRDSARIVHRELIASITGSVAFAVPLIFALNPGLAASFPWLATQAQAWEAYRFNKLRFCYYTRTGSNVPGSVMLVPDYDSSDAAPASEQIASSYEDVAEDAPWKDICSKLRNDAMFTMGPRKYIRTGAVPAGNDIKTFDAGQLFVCTTDGTAVNWGKLWVEYDVTLYTPQLNPAGNGVLSSQHFLGTTPTSASAFANSVSQAGSSSLVTLAGNVMTFNQAGRYVVTTLIAGTTVTVVANVLAGAGNALVNSFWTNTGSIQTGSGNAAVTQSTTVQAVVGGTLTWNNTVVLGTTSETVIAQIPAAQV